MAKISVNMKPLDELFPAAEGAVVQRLPLDKLYEPEGHPFKVLKNKEMEKLVESIKKNGVLQPILVRRVTDDEYEVISGNRRCFAARAAGLMEIDAIIESPEKDRDKSVEAMVDTNLCQREQLSAMELARALAAKAKVMSHRGSAEGEHTAVALAKELGWSPAKVKRYIALAKCEDAVLVMVDEKRIPVGVAIDLAALEPQQQREIAMAVEDRGCKISARAAEMICEAVETSKTLIPARDIEDIIASVDETDRSSGKSATVKIDMDELKRFFPRNMTTEKVKEQILQILAASQRQRDNVR